MPLHGILEGSGKTYVRHNVRSNLVAARLKVESLLLVMGTNGPEDKLDGEYLHHSLGMSNSYPHLHGVNPQLTEVDAQLVSFYGSTRNDDAKKKKR